VLIVSLDRRLEFLSSVWVSAPLSCLLRFISVVVVVFSAPVSRSIEQDSISRWAFQSKAPVLVLRCQLPAHQLRSLSLTARRPASSQLFWFCQSLVFSPVFYSAWSSSSTCSSLRSGVGQDFPLPLVPPGVVASQFSLAEPWFSSWAAGSKILRFYSSHSSPTVFFQTRQSGVRWNIYEDINSSSIRFLSSISHSLAGINLCFRCGS
jgi:hypothetical protein